MLNFTRQITLKHFKQNNVLKVDLTTNKTAKQIRVFAV